MRYQIQTTPILDAFKENDGCPMCKLYERSETRLVKQYVGEAVMEPEYRIKVNERGFCDRHLKMLYVGGNKLGVSLQVITRTEHVIETIPALKNAKAAKKASEKLAAELGTCVICDEVDEMMERYSYTVAQLYDNEADFRKLFAAERGFCMPHFIQLLRYVSYAKGSAEAYAAALSAKQTGYLRQLNSDLERFTRRFDYRSTDKFSGGTDDALEKSITALRGNIIGK